MPEVMMETLSKYWKTLSGVLVIVFTAGGFVAKFKSEVAKRKRLEAEIQLLKESKQDILGCSEKQRACSKLFQFQLDAGHHQFETLHSKIDKLSNRQEERYDGMMDHLIALHKQIEDRL